MKTDIKDVIHLYLGCEMQTEKGAKFILEPQHFPSNWKDEYIFTKAKPILRPLSDMTNEEEKIAYKLEFNQDRVESQLNEYFYSVDCWLPQTTIYLINQGFDLFGLIESGQSLKK
jgi:hypothetical protein